MHDWLKPEDFQSDPEALAKAMGFHDGQAKLTIYTDDQLGNMVRISMNEIGLRPAGSQYNGSIAYQISTNEEARWWRVWENDIRVHSELGRFDAGLGVKQDVHLKLREYLETQLKELTPFKKYLIRYEYKQLKSDREKAYEEVNRTELEATSARLKHATLIQAYTEYCDEHSKVIYSED
jgi:hypothetical protein